MPNATRSLSDAELLELARDPDAATYRARLTPEERGRLSALLASGEEPPMMASHAPDQGEPPSLLSALMQVPLGSDVADAGMGATKGILTSLDFLSKLVGLGDSGTPVDLSPKGPAQSAGYLMEQAGEMAVPLPKVPTGLGPVAERVYRGYLKPSLSESKVARAGQIVKTALEEGLPIAGNSSSRASKRIRQLREEVKRITASSTKTGDLHQIAETVRAWGRKNYEGPGADPSDLDAILKVADTIDNGAGAAVDVPIKEVQATKERLDRAIGKKNFGVERGVTVEARKQGRSESRRIIETAEPSTAPNNLRESRLIDTRGALRSAIERERNTDALLGARTLGSMAIGGGYGAYQQDSIEGLLATAITRGLVSPRAMTRLMTVAYKFKDAGLDAANAVRLAIQQVSGNEEP
jgi:hypothetical protein